jgi:two-component SAPR family response regulator
MKLEVLNVDDDKMVLFIYEKMMGHADFSNDPKSYLNGYETLDYISKYKNEDTKFLIFLDINMPDLNGWQFMDELNTIGLTKYCHVLVVTSSIDLSDKERSETYPVVIDFVEKPINIEKLKGLKQLKPLKPFFEN